MRRLAPALAAVGLLAACGGPTSEPPPPTGTEPAAATRLEIAFGADIRGVASTFTSVLRCEPTGGTVLDPEAVCARLAAEPGLLVSPPGAPCDRSPEEWEVTIAGTYRGRAIDVRFDRCHPAEVERWMQVVDFDIPVPGV